MPPVAFAQNGTTTFAEFQINLFNPGSTGWDITFEFEAVSNTIVWDENNYITSQYHNGSYTCNSSNTVVSWDWCVDDSPTGSMGRGIYQIVARKNGTFQAIFYMDYRTSDWTGSPDVGFTYDITNKKFKDGSTIINNTTQTVWDLTTFSHVTADLEPCAPLYFTIDSYNNRPELNWEMCNGAYVQTYKIYRSINFPHFGTEYIGSTTDIYYVDYDLQVGSGQTAYYTVKAINGNKTNSSTEDVGVSGFLKQSKSHDVQEDIPLFFNLKQNYPNPFNPTTNIDFSLKEDSQVRLIVFNIEGQEVVQLVNSFIDKGNYSVTFNASVLTSGVYYYQLIANNFITTKKLVLMK